MRFSVDVCWAVFSAVCFSLGAMTPVGLTMGQTVNHSPLYTFNGDSGDELGVSVSGAGDVNGDGFADLIVGAPGDAPSGSARVYSGIDGNVLYTFDGDDAGDQLGISVSGAGDVNGDGFADLIVGARLDDNNGFDSGSVRVYSGIDGNVLYTFDGDNRFDELGVSVSGAGDVNGDGFADLIVGAPGVDTNGDGSGSARVYSGIDGNVLHTFIGAAGDLGVSVSGAGDVNGDGVADLIVGAGESARVFVGEGSAPEPLLGDVNTDGDVSFSDIPAFISVLLAGEFQIEADIDLNGAVNFADIGGFIAILQNQ